MFENGIEELAENTATGEVTTTRRGISAGAAREVIESGGKLGHFDLVRCRVRWFSEGVALGSESFLKGLVRTVGADGDTTEPRPLPISSGSGGSGGWFSWIRRRGSAIG